MSQEMLPAILELRDAGAVANKLKQLIFSFFHNEGQFDAQVADDNDQYEAEVSSNTCS